MDETHYADIVEVRTFGVRKTNACLEAGYRLLGIGVSTFEENRRAEQASVSHSTTFIAKRFAFLLGRPEGVEAITFEHDEAEAPA